MKIIFVWPISNVAYNDIFISSLVIRTTNSLNVINVEFIERECSRLRTMSPTASQNIVVYRCPPIQRR